MKADLSKVERFSWELNGRPLTEEVLEELHEAVEAHISKREALKNTEETPVWGKEAK